jgi:hypothetical protein
MNHNIKFEIWNHKRVLVVRNSKGQILSRRNQKGSGIKTKEQVYNHFKEFNTLRKNTGHLSFKNPKVENKDIKTLTFKGKDKNLKLNLSNAIFKNATKIGNNTISIRTQNKLFGYNYNQIIMKVFWGDKETSTVGFSDIRGTRKQAFNRARSDAITKGLITYHHKIIIHSNGTGLAFKVDENNNKIKYNIVYFSYVLSVQTYINTTKKIKKQRSRY